jgi:DNA recombination protein RmuC
VGAAVASIVVIATLARGRRALQDEAAAARSAQAVAESRLADLAANHATLSDAHRRLDEERLGLARDRERLGTTLDATNRQLERERAEAAGVRADLERSNTRNTQLDSDCRVLKAQNEDLARRVVELDAASRAAADEHRSHSAEIAQLRAQAAALETERKGLEVRLAEQRSWIEEQTRFFEQKIGGIAGQLLEEKSRAFTEVNRKEIDAVVSPFKEQLKEFRERVDSIYASDTRDRGQLHEQILQLTSLNQAVSHQAEALTKALTISSKATGDWGEMILQKILEDSGLREGREYTLQHTVEAEDQSLQRPDAVIFLPEDRQVVVDAKVSNKAWKEYCAADDESRAERLAEHLASLRAHIRELSARDYPRSPDLRTVDFVLMFVPVEAALLAALAHDESLYTEAYRAKIILVTPSTLMAVLKLIEGMWVFQRRKESADKIAEAGRKLYDKLTTFSGTFLEIGEAIERTHATFERARGQLATGKGNAIRLAQKMVELGVGPGKVMPPRLVELAEPEADDEDSRNDEAGSAQGGAAASETGAA